jgi:hypothetical protein
MSVPLMLKGKLERFSGFAGDAVQDIEGRSRRWRRSCPAAGGKHDACSDSSSWRSPKRTLARRTLRLSICARPGALPRKNAGPSSPDDDHHPCAASQLLTGTGSPARCDGAVAGGAAPCRCGPALAALSRRGVGPQRFHEGQARRRLGQLDESPRVLQRLGEGGRRVPTAARTARFAAPRAGLGAHGSGSASTSARAGGTGA